MSQFYSNLVCEAGCFYPAVVAEKGQGMSTLTHCGAGCSQPAVVAERSGYEYPDAR